ncbi:MAG: hypothetical protein ACI82S_001452 [Patiriisocius sp.]|jgi:hypothetical protein
MILNCSSVFLLVFIVCKNVYSEKYIFQSKTVEYDAIEINYQFRDKASF